MSSTYELMQRRHRQACGAFAWLGQSFAFCDDCGQPYWDHTHYGMGASERGPGRRVLKVITRASAARVRDEWED